MKVKIKKLVKSAVIPTYAKEGDAGMDLRAVSKEYDDDGNTVYGTGLAFEIPKGYVGLLFPRSSNAKTSLYLTNSVGVIDSGYRGEVKFKYKSAINMVNPLKYWWQSEMLKKRYTDLDVNCLNRAAYEVGDRVGQLIILPYPNIEFEEVEELSETERGEGGFGSTNGK